ncbi:aminotransferase class IV [Candidatus Saccharibacteria bacterium]|nr:aminotransferase class IV [Candidatus Saccharibacteria bacterium]
MADLYSKVYFGNKIIDANQASLSIASSAVLYGLSVYTVFPVSINDKGEVVVFRLEDHFKRLTDSAKIIGMDRFGEEWHLDSFTDAVQELILANDIRSNVFVRATVHVDSQIAGTRSRGLSTVLSMFIYSADSILPRSGARLKTSVWRRIPDYAIPSRAKVNGAYVNSVLAKQDAIDSGYDDCIFLDAQGHVCELSAANVFMVRDNKLITPDATHDLLEGINRRTIIEIARDLDIEVVERSIDLTELYIADEVFACGTSAYLTPVVEIDARTIPSSGKMTKRLGAIHSRVISGNSQEYKRYITIVS